MTAAVAIQPDIELQLELERLFDKNQLMKRVRQEFLECADFSFETYLTELDIPVKFGIDLLANMAIRKRADLPTLLGCLRHHLDDAQATADMLVKCAEADLVDWEPATERANGTMTNGEFVVRYTLDDETQAELDRFQYPLPMVTKPLLVTNNLENGSLTSKSSLLLNDNHHDGDICLDHINRVNQIKLSINLDVAHAIQNKWKGLDKRKSDETWADFMKRRKAFEKYDKVAKDVLGLLVSEGNEIHLTHRYDFRGRTYCAGHHVTYQGTDWNKAVIEFADKEELLGE